MEGFYILFAIIGLVWFLPLLIISSSSKTTGGEKIAWVLAVLFISWFAWIFYMLLAPISRKNKPQPFQNYQPVINVYEKSSTIDQTQHAKSVSHKPSLKEWSKDNPGKSINDYYTKFGR